MMLRSTRNFIFASNHNKRMREGAATHVVLKPTPTLDRTATCKSYLGDAKPTFQMKAHNDNNGRPEIKRMRDPPILEGIIRLSSVSFRISVHKYNLHWFSPMAQQYGLGLVGIVNRFPYSRRRVGCIKFSHVGELQSIEDCVGERWDRSRGASLTRPLSAEWIGGGRSAAVN